MEREKIKIKRELENEPEFRVDNLENLMAFCTPEIEKRMNFYQQETEKRKQTKTEEPTNYTEHQTVTELKKKISELKNQVLEKDQAIEEYCEKMKGLEKEIQESKLHKWMDTKIKEDMKDTLSQMTLSNKLLRQQNAEGNRMAEELSRKISACEEEKKMADWVIDDMERRGLENVLYIQDLRRQNLEASRSLEELSRRISACEEEKRMADRDQEEMKRREAENCRCVEDLRRQNLDANQKVDELRDRLLACEEEKNIADRFREEMEVRELDLWGRLSRAEQSVEEMKKRGLEACKAAEVSVKRFGNVVPIAEQLCELLKMRVDDLVSDFAEFRNGATTTHEEEGGVHASKALELTLYDQSTKSKKRHFQETQIIDIIDCDEVEDSVERSKCAVEANKRKGIFGADMARAFMEDDELCMHAVCALYRRHLSTPESVERPSRRFYHFEASRGRALGDYLINGDPELSLTRSVDEVKQKDPDIINQCRSLAIFYSSYFTALSGTHEPLSRSLSLELVSDV
ncbi:hypothetical protein CASFOL_020212 [Castilleja foliolosa]|uniref:Uncharacterized protein n=1 Tax=Castilleja foliolosa TaxID=1961234 RepID=A0ABD3D3Y4_9LAMI